MCDLFKHFQNLGLVQEPQETNVVLQKAVLTHLLDGDYAKIEKIKREYPVEPFMNLLGKHDSIVPIDLDKLFTKSSQPTVRNKNGKMQILMNSRWHNMTDEEKLARVKDKYGEDSNEYVDALVTYQSNKHYNTPPPKERVVKEPKSNKYIRYTDAQLFEFVKEIILPKNCVYKGDVYEGENSKKDEYFLMFKKRFESELGRSAYYKSRGVTYETFDDGNLHRLFGMSRKQLLKQKQGK